MKNAQKYLLAVSLLLLCSCKRNYHCWCNVSSSPDPVKVTEEPIYSTKNKAKKSCAKFEDVYSESSVESCFVLEQ